MNTTQEQQFTFDNQRTVKVEDSFVLPSRGSLSSQQACNMPTAGFTSTDILKHPVLIESVTWSTTDTPGTELVSFTIPAIFAELDTFHTRMLEVYSYFKPKVCLRFVINATKFHQGKLIAFYDPMETTVASGTLNQKRIRNQYMATGQPNVLLDAGYSNTGVLEIPFEHVLSYMTTNSAERAPQMGTVYLMVLNALNVSDGVTPELEVQVMLSCSEVELHIPMRPHSVELISSSRTHLHPQGLPTAAIPTIKPKISSGFRQVVDSSVQSVKSLGSGFWNLVTGNFNGFNDDMATLWSSTIDRFEGGFKMLGMDKPNSLDNKTENMLCTTSPIAHMKGIDGSIRLAATSSGGYTRMDFSAANENEMNIKEIIKTKMMFKQLDWSTSEAAGIALFTTPVHPGICNYSPSAQITGYSLMNPTFLSYISLAYEQWHGSINFRFDFTATQFHTGRILAVFEPNSSTTGAVDDITHYTNNPSYLFDLHENKTFEINIPFVSSTPRKDTSNPTTVAAFNIDDELSIGKLSLFVYTPLAVTNNVPNTIPINCYISAGDDFVFEVPRIRDDIYYPSDISIPPAPTSRHLHPQALEALPLRSEDRSSPPSIIKGSGVTQLVCHYNEEVADIRDFAKRYAPFLIKSDTFAANPAGEPVQYIQHGLETTLASFVGQGPSAQYPLTFMSSLYTFWSGSLRYKYMPFCSRNQTLRSTVLNALGKTSSAPLVGTGGFSFLQGSAGKSYPHHFQMSCQDNSLEFEIPFYSFYNQFVVNPIQSSGNFNDLIYGSGSYRVLFETDNPTNFPSSKLTFTCYVAAGDDFKCRFLVSPPATLILTSS